MFIFLDGRILEEKNAVIDVFDRGFLFGDGLFETMRAYEGRVFLLNEHLERLEASARELELGMGYSKEEFSEAIYEVLRANNLKEARIRLSLSRGRFSGSVEYDGSEKGMVVVSAVLVEEGKELKELSLLRSGLRLSRDYVLARHKTLSYLPYLYALRQARRRGADEGLLLSDDGKVLEGSRANFFMLREDRLITPGLGLPILPGITRSKIMELGKGLGLLVEEGEFGEDEIFGSEAVFLTNSIIEVGLVRSYEGRVIGGKRGEELVKSLWRLYQEQARSSG